MNNTAFLNTVRFVVLVFFQVTVFNNIHFWGFITPYPYILFILLYPLNINRNLFLILSFALGLILDIFNNSGGIHTTACIMLDRKSTRLNSSHVRISYAVFCL